MCFRESTPVVLQHRSRIDIRECADVEARPERDPDKAVSFGKVETALDLRVALVCPADVAVGRPQRHQRVGDDRDRVGPLRERQRTIGDRDGLLELLVQQAGAGELAEDRDEPGSSARSANSSAAGSRSANAASVRYGVSSAYPRAAVARATAGRSPTAGAGRLPGGGAPRPRRAARRRRRHSPARSSRAASLAGVGRHRQRLAQERDRLLVRAEGGRPIGGRDERDPRLGGQRIGLRPVRRVRVRGEVVAGQRARELVGAEDFEEARRREVADLAVAAGRACCRRPRGSAPGRTRTGRAPAIAGRASRVSSSRRTSAAEARLERRLVDARDGGESLRA